MKDASRIPSAPGLLCWIFFFAAVAGFSPSGAATAQEAAEPVPIVEKAVACETIRELQPVNPAIAFSIEYGKVTCYSRFTQTSGVSFIRHLWYRRDELVTEKRLLVKPPHWLASSSIQLRGSDIGPWRIEIIDPQDRELALLRFSVTR
jgi:hypothetical protein